MRVCRPASWKISTKRSEAPLITWDCATKSGTELTYPATRTQRTTRSRSPSSAGRRAEPPRQRGPERPPQVQGATPAPLPPLLDAEFPSELADETPLAVPLG